MQPLLNETLMNPFKLIDKYYKQGSRARYMLIEHSRLVTQKALEMARRVKHLNPDTEFIRRAAMLHDIGIMFTNAPGIGCFGEADYVCHGHLGAELLKKEGLPGCARVCETHVGVGLSVKDIMSQRIPIPKKDMVPTSLEEQIICFADKFFSKNPATLYERRPFEKIKKEISCYGRKKGEKLEEWARLFGR